MHKAVILHVIQSEIFLGRTATKKRLTCENQLNCCDVRNVDYNNIFIIYIKIKFILWCVSIVAIFGRGYGPVVNQVTKLLTYVHGPSWWLAPVIHIGSPPSNRKLKEILYILHVIILNHTSNIICSYIFSQISFERIISETCLTISGVCHLVIDGCRKLKVTGSERCTME
jgi:hypothetical protein